MHTHSITDRIARLRPLLALAYLTTGGTLAALSAARYMGVPFTPLIPLVCVGTIFGVYALNRFTDMKEDFLNDSYRSIFFVKRKRLLTAVWVTLGAVGVGLALTQHLSFYFMLLLAVGVFYSCKLFPWYTPGRGMMFIRLKEIPFMKNVLVAGAWGASIFFVPLLLAPGRDLPVSLFSVGVLSGAMMLSTLNNTVFCDILDISGDRLAGNKTLPVLIGAGRTQLVLMAVNGAWIVTVAVVAARGLLDLHHLVLLVALATYPLAYLIPFWRRTMRRQVLEFVCETDLVVFAAGMAVLPH